VPTLDWIGKKAVLNHHRQVPFRLLKCDEKLSVGDPNSGNLLIQGDNLEALKALLPYYAGQVKCIYIDPPYNTGNEDWSYNDNVSSPEIRRWLGRVVGKESEDLSRHDKWLCMMYPRIALLQLFLRDDGVIFASIDDNEHHHFRLLMEEIFGPQNFIASLIWEKAKKGDAKLVSIAHEYIVVYAKSKRRLTELNTSWRRRKTGVDEVLEYYDALRRKIGGDHNQIRRELQAWYRSLPSGDPRKSHKHYNWSDDRGLYFAADFSGPDDGRESRPRYDIPHPLTGKPCAKPSTGWRWDETRTRRALAESPPRIHFGRDESTIPCRKSYLFKVDQEPMSSVFYKDGRAATLEVEALLGPGAFAFPKDSDVLADLFGLLTRDDDIVLDSFAGSGTSAHAIFKLNCKDGGRRRFILIEIDPNVCRDKTRERLLRVVQNHIALKSPEVSNKPDEMLGFRYCNLGKPLFDDQGNIAGHVQFADLAAHIFFTETGVPLPKVSRSKSPMLGVHQDKAVYLLFNGIMGDKRPDGGNVLTGEILRLLPSQKGPRVIYGEGCRLSPQRLRREGIVFKQIPYEIKVG
jgi:DNA modification methylase